MRNPQREKHGEDPKKGWCRTQSFTPTLTGKASVVAPLKETVLCISLWKEVTMLFSLGGQPIFCRRLKSPLLLTRSMAFYQVHESDLQWLLLLSVFLLQLA